MANALSKDGPITVVVNLKIKAESAARARVLELFQEQIADIHATEPPGHVHYSFFRDNNAEDEYTVVATFASDAIREAFRTKPKHEEINGKLFSEGLIDGEPKARICTEVAGTRLLKLEIPRSDIRSHLDERLWRYWKDGGSNLV